MITSREYLLATVKDTGWSEDTQIDLLCRFIDQRWLNDELGSFLRTQVVEESNLTETCVRCGSILQDNGRCSDETCPFEDVRQDDEQGWIGHPDHPDVEEKITPKCVRCGSSLQNGKCSDETCPFSDTDQDDDRGWAGHPDRP